MIVCLFTIHFIFSFFGPATDSKVKFVNSFLSEKISQNPLQKFFGAQGNKGKAMRILQFPSLLKTHTGFTSDRFHLADRYYWELQ